MKKFRCAICRRKLRCDPDWTEEDKIKEFNENFPDQDINDIVSVCGDCYQWANSQIPFKKGTKK